MNTDDTIYVPAGADITRTHGYYAKIVELYTDAPNEHGDQYMRLRVVRKDGSPSRRASDTRAAFIRVALVRKVA